MHRLATSQRVLSRNFTSLRWFGRTGDLVLEVYMKFHGLSAFFDLLNEYFLIFPHFFVHSYRHASYHHFVVLDNLTPVFLLSCDVLLGVTVSLVVFVGCLSGMNVERYEEFQLMPYSVVSV